MRFADIIAAVMVAALWGGNFVAAKYGIVHFPPFFLTGTRFAIVFCLLVFFVPKITLAQLKNILPVAFLGTFHFSLIFVALHQGLDIASSVLVGQLGVPFSCLFGAMFLDDKIGPRQIAGIAVAFTGIAIVAGNPNILSHGGAFVIAMGSALAWGGANVFVKRISGMGHMQLLAWMSLATVPMLLILSLMFEEPSPTLLTSGALSSWLGLFYTVIASTIVAYGLWYYLLGRYDVSQVAPFSLLTPVFGIACGQLFFTESLSWQVLLGGVITVAGVTIIVIRKPKLAELAEAT